MPEFLDAFDVERDSLLKALSHFETVWERFQERRALEVEGSELSDSLIAGELAVVRNELESTQFTVGIFGLIKRGKSTLLNALIGREVSSMHVTPETAVPVYVSYSDTPGATVHFADGTIRNVAVEDVHEFTSQKSNPNNRLGVTYVEQVVPVGFLKNGTRLIDTPGLDDAEADEVYTERTLQELDVTDAGLVVFLSPPTVGATEMQFLTKVSSRELKKTFLICNMYPQHFHDKQTRMDVLNYVGGRVVEASRRAGRSGEVRIYPVCALEAWQARLEDDIDKWKRSGADRLLRDIEIYLSESAGSEVLHHAADRVAKAAEMAKAEVRVRQQLLDDPARLSEFRQQVDRQIRDLEHQFDTAVSAALTDVGPLKMRVRGMALGPFTKAKRTVEKMDSVGELENWISRFRRELEVSGEMASRQFAQGFEAVVNKLRERLQDQFHSVMAEIAPNLPKIELSSNALIMTPDQVQALQRAQRRGRDSGRTGAIAGGLAGGGAALVAGTAMLGPLGLLGGALAGWKLTGLVTDIRSLKAAKESIIERLDEISNELLADLDRQVNEAVESIRAGVDKHRRAFASDLYQQFNLVQRISEDQSALEAQRRDAERFTQAFDACAARARNAIGVV